MFQRKDVLLVVSAWLLSLVTTLAIVYVAPSISAPISGRSIADYAVTDTKLATNAIPFARGVGPGGDQTDSTTWEGMGISAGISLNRRSHLLIIFETEVATDAVVSPHYTEAVYFRALVGTESLDTLRSEISNFTTLTYVRFYDVDSGVHSVTMQWHCLYGSEVRSYNQILTLIAFPA